MSSRLCFAFAMLMAFFAYSQENNINVNIIPLPVSVEITDGEFVFTPRTDVRTTLASNKAVDFFKGYLEKEWEISNLATTETMGSNFIELTDKGTEDLPAGGYRLTITPEKVTIAGKDEGLFYGIQSFLQLLPLEKSGQVNLPCVIIEDYPRFEYRGMHLDVSRHFFSIDVVKDYIDVMASYKLNNLHWHLTDDQGWRIEIKKYPKLTEIGGVRRQTLVGGHYWDRKPQFFDQTPYKGYYTQEEIKEVVQYAADRYINIIPEIEMPGHSSAAIAAYPELSCNPKGDHKVAETFGIFSEIFCPTEATFTFLENVLTEVMELFPSKYIHIGGDEAPKDAWKESKFAQKLIKKKNLKDEHGLQSYFIHRMEEFLNSKGRQIIGWDEILEGGLAPNATVMSWQGEEGGIAAARQHHDVIICSQKNHLYFNDRINFRSDFEKARYAYDLKDLYDYDPVPGVLSESEQKYIKGVQGAIWTEYVTTPARLEYTLLPKMVVLSEIAWTPLSRKNYENFLTQRLPVHLARLDAAGKHYRVPVAIGPVDTLMEGSEFKITLKPSVAGGKIYYTTNGFEPSELDELYKAPLVFKIPEGEQRELQTIVVSPTNKKSDPTRTVMFNNRSELENLTFNATPALNYTIYEGDVSSIESLAQTKSISSDTVTSIKIPEKMKESGGKGIIYKGFLNIERDGFYTFEVNSSGTVRLNIDGKLIVGNKETQRKVPLLQGFHQFELLYFNPTKDKDQLKVFVSGSGEAKKELPKEMLGIFQVDPNMTGIDGQ